MGAVFQAADGDPQPFESNFLEVLIDFKWRSYVRQVFMLDWLLYAAMSVLYTIHAMWFITYSKKPDDDVEKRLGIGLYIIILCLHCYFVKHEIKQLFAIKDATPLSFLLRSNVAHM